MLGLLGDRVMMTGEREESVGYAGVWEVWKGDLRERRLWCEDGKGSGRLRRPL